METRNIVVVIDPGHGGENLGAEYETFTEKELTMKVANAMYKKLSQFEGIDVYMTRTADAELSLEERVDVAKEKNADFFFCLHFNMSVNHNLFGAETWISAFGEQYAKGYDFAQIEMEMLTDLGLFNRGIKTKLKDRKTEDYYGVIRHATEGKIPSVIIEHCHLDNINDYPFYHENTDQWLERFGELDALAVAKYYKLYNPETGEDFRSYTYEETPIPTKVVRPDPTKPENVTLTMLEVNQEEGYASFQVTAREPDSRLIYYGYSYDEGKTPTERFAWEDGATEMTIQIPLPEEEAPVTCLVYNLADLYTVSNAIKIPALDHSVYRYEEDIENPNLHENELATEELENLGVGQEDENESNFTQNSNPLASNQDTNLGNDDLDTYEEIASPSINTNTGNNNNTLYFCLIGLSLSALMLMIALSTMLLKIYTIKRNRARSNVRYTSEMKRRMDELDPTE